MRQAAAPGWTGAAAAAFWLEQQLAKPGAEAQWPAFAGDLGERMRAEGWSGSPQQFAKGTAEFL
eukprot:9454524-Alexandrium_andersonii.AAC.1